MTVSTLLVSSVQFSSIMVGGSGSSRFTARSGSEVADESESSFTGEFGSVPEDVGARRMVGG